MGPILPHLYKAMKASRRDAALERELSRTELQVFKATRRRAKNAGLVFEIGLDDFKKMVAASGGRCQATNIEFSDDNSEGERYRLFRLSIDRIDSSLGYHPDNCQLVCAVFNMAKSDSHVQIIHTIALEYARNLGCVIPDILVDEKSEPRWEY